MHTEEEEEEEELEEEEWKRKTKEAGYENEGVALVFIKDLRSSRATWSQGYGQRAAWCLEGRIWGSVI
ncbi:unnamed protein product [Prunus armeniaca]|uniref:Uncharacterized protein n=1 Tax=Prunus armeniaca TaxID=36596 RepID=A0A6J5XE19_PRUAR|nr:unnamed protein product [Prunus armeniaca]